MQYCKTGTVEGTAATISITCGFSPDVVFLMNVDDAGGGSDLWWTTDMGDAYGRKMKDAGAGTTDLTYVATLGVTATDMGFNIGADTDVNVGSETIMWIAWRSNE